MTAERITGLLDIYMPAGRPRAYTHEEMMSALRLTKGLVYLAAKQLGCKPDTIYARVRISPDVAGCLKSQRGEFVDVAELKLNQAVLGGEPWAVALVLKTLGKDRGYVERSETRTVTDDDIKSEIESELARMASRRLARPAGAAANGKLATGPPPRPGFDLPPGEDGA
jgi:hypothetical protein